MTVESALISIRTNMLAGGARLDLRTSATTTKQKRERPSTG